MSIAQSVDGLVNLSVEALQLAQPWSCPEHPVKLWIGHGSLQKLLDEPDLPVLVISTEHAVDRSGLSDTINRHPDWHVFNGIRPNPGPDLIEQAARRAHQLHAKTIVGLGGGSALDAARCVSLMLGHTDRVSELQSRIKAKASLSREVALVQVPTTSGTGSEVTPWASVWAPDGTKSSVDHPAGFADRAYIDPLLTASMPTRLTAAVGLDALTHAMESLWGRHATPTSSKFATRAIELIHPNLEAVVRSPDQQGRDALTLGSVLAGMALSQTRSAIAHALSYQLTGEYGLEHGLAVGLIALAVLRLDQADAPGERAKVIEAGGGGVDTLPRAIEQIFLAIDHRPNLGSFGVPRSGIEAIIETALSSNRLTNMSGTWHAAELGALLKTIS